MSPGIHRAGMSPALDRAAFAHDAVLILGPDGDQNAPGGAITVALCGAWTHEPPCPLAPHHTRVQRSGTEVTLRVLFAADPVDESHVRRLVDEALARGWGAAEDGSRTDWQLVESGASPVRPEEEDHARRLIRSCP
jgi:hypothetical protein